MSKENNESGKSPSATISDGSMIPKEFDGYRIIKPIGRGGMGVVYLGHDTLIQRPVAIKFISISSSSPETKQRFLIEARAVARLQHPCIVTIYRAGEIDGHPYIVSEYIEGQVLDRIKIPVKWGRALEIGYELARGLAVAHKKGVIHRDIKPGNIILTSDGTVKILDFGIAVLLGETTDPIKIAESAAQQTIKKQGTTLPPENRHKDYPACESKVPKNTNTFPVNQDEITVLENLPTTTNDKENVSQCMSNQLITKPGMIMGTPSYMAPEVWNGKSATFASDVYSLGVLLYNLCCGKPPHRPRVSCSTVTNVWYPGGYMDEASGV